MRRLLTSSSRADGLQRLVAGVVAEAVVEVLEEVAVAQQQAEGVPAALGARELVVDHALEAAAVEQAGQRVGAGRVGELVDQASDPLAQLHEEHAGDDDRPGDQHEGGDVLVGVDARRRVAEHPGAQHHRRVVEDGEQAQAHGLATGEEVEGVEGDPHVEEQVGAGAGPGEDDGQRGEHGRAERPARGDPVRGARAEDQEKDRGGERRTLDRQQAGGVVALRVREQHSERPDRARRDEEVGLGPRGHGGRERADGERVFA